MAESVIISAIESLETSKILLKKPDLWEDNFEKLYNLIVEMSDFEEDSKEMLPSSGSRILSAIEKMYSFVVGIADSGENKKEMLHSLLFRMADKNINSPVADHWERNNEKVYNLAGLREDSKEKMYRLMAGMADFWEDNKEKLYLLLLRIPWKDYKDEIKSSRYATFPEMMEIWREEEMIMNRADNYNLLVEIADLWGDGNDDEGELHKEKLHSLLSEMPVFHKHYDTKSYAKEICRMSGEIAGLWKD